MKAVILAGGEGSRLRPLTCSTPKPLAPLCGKPMVQYMLELLARHGVREAAFTLRYLGRQIEEYFGAQFQAQNILKSGRSPAIIDLQYCYEKEALGTAGAVRQAAGLLREGYLLVVSGDALCDFDFSAAVNFHEERHADVTILGKRVPDPRNYGLILSRDDGLVERFLEKPSFGDCATDLANTGCYIFSRKALDEIPAQTPFDFAGDLFPLLLRQGAAVYVKEMEGYWRDVGDGESYLTAQKDLLCKRVKANLAGVERQRGIWVETEEITDQKQSGDGSPLQETYPGVRFVPPLYIGKNVSIAPGAVIEKNSVLCRNTTICSQARVHGSVLLEGVFLGERAVCNDSVICRNARILEGASVFEQAMVGGDAIVGADAVVTAGVRVWQGKRLEGGLTVSQDVKYGPPVQLCLDDEGICGASGGPLDPQSAALCGSCLSMLGKNIAVGWRGGSAAEALARAVAAGVCAAGSDAWMLGASSEVILDFALRKGRLQGGCFIEAGPSVRLQFFSAGGLPLTRKEERLIESGLKHHEFATAALSEYGRLMDISAMKELYRLELSRMAAEKLSGVRGRVNCATPVLQKLAEQVLQEANAAEGQEIIFHVSADGRKVSAYTEETGYVFHEKLLLLAVETQLEMGLPVALPSQGPAVAEELARQYGGQVLRYHDCSVDDSDAAARSLAKRCPFPRDGLELMLRVLQRLSRQKQTLKKALDGLPVFTSASRYIPVEDSPASILRRMAASNATFHQKGQREGITSGNGSRVIIRPTKMGKGVMIFAESFQNETAAELCDFYEALLTEQKKPGKQTEI